MQMCKWAFGSALTGPAARTAVLVEATCGQAKWKEVEAERERVLWEKGKATFLSAVISAKEVK